MVDRWLIGDYAYLLNFSRDWNGESGAAESALASTGEFSSDPPKDDSKAEVANPMQTAS